MGDDRRKDEGRMDEWTNDEDFFPPAGGESAASAASATRAVLPSVFADSKRLSKCCMCCKRYKSGAVATPQKSGGDELGSNLVEFGRMKKSGRFGVAIVFCSKRFRKL